LIDQKPKFPKDYLKKWGIDMGGYGSGRRSHKPKVEECISLDSNQLSRDGCLKNFDDMLDW